MRKVTWSHQRLKSTRIPRILDPESHFGFLNTLQRAIIKKVGYILRTLSENFKGSKLEEMFLMIFGRLKFDFKDLLFKATLYPKFWRIVKELKEVFEWEEF